jgi:hypothetical protein
VNKENAGADMIFACKGDEERLAALAAETDLRVLAQMNAHGILEPLRNDRGEAIGYVWHPDGKERWRKLKTMLDALEKKHRITDRIWLEDTVMAAALAYRHPGALPKKDVEDLVAAMSQVMKALREEGGARIASILMDRDRNLRKARLWDYGNDEKQFASVQKLDTGLLFNPIARSSFPAKLADTLDKLGLFDGWEDSYERACAVRMRLSRIAEDLSQLECALKRVPKTTRKPDNQLHSAIAVLRNRWNEGPAGKVAKHKFVESVIAFVDPAAASKVRSALRHRLKDA